MLVLVLMMLVLMVLVLMVLVLVLMDGGYFLVKRKTAGYFLAIFFLVAIE